MTRGKSILAASLCAGGAAVVLWWLADHRRGTAWAVAAVRRRFPEVPQISAAALAAWCAEAEDGGGPAPVIVDARSAEEHAVSHLPGAVHLDEAVAEPEQIRAMLDPRRPHVLYCSAGYRACRLARKLRAAGVRDVANLEGGIFKWANEGRPVMKAGVRVRQVHPYHSLFARMLRPEARH
jgi:rhodanese-related sulfurtransferase